jgi:sigma-B regulation protein RsbU (phosphoserine phosphatase)
MDKDRILLVEDEEDTRYILHRLLDKNGYEVVTAINGVNALEILKEFKPKVILADWTMPEMDGLELCNQLKAKEETKLIYFIVLTARATLKDRVLGLDVGADDFLVKPVENQELLARIRSGVRIHNLQHELKSIEHNKALIEMAATIAHKINNPLASLTMTIDGIAEEIPEKFKDDLYIVEESIKRIKGFVETLQNLKNPEFTKYALDNKMLKLD